MRTIRSEPQALVVLVPLVVALIGCTPGTTATSRPARQLPSPAQTPVDPGNDPTNYRAIPVSGSAELGVLYRYVLYTHCGIDYWASWDFDGSFWDVAGQSTSDPLARELMDISNPEDHGTIELVSSGTARYSASNGLVIDLTRSPDAERRGVVCA